MRKASEIFTVTPAFDLYNGKPLTQNGSQLFRIDGYCSHLSAGAGTVLYVNEPDAHAWIAAHEQYHQ
jgi:hypothetical protein